jgi:hypothetical protein
VGEAHLAEIDRIVRLYLLQKDDLEPVPAKELLERVRKALVTVLDVRPPEEFAAGHLRRPCHVCHGPARKRL